MKSKKLNIKNPQKTIFRRWLFILLLFILIGYKSYSNFDINSFDGMFIMISLVIIPTSLFFLYTTSKNVKVLDAAINNGDMITHWKYTKKEWENYLINEKEYRTGEGGLIAIFLSVMTALIFIPFALIVQEWAMIVVMFILFGMYGFMGFIFPKIVYWIRVNRTGEVILLEKGIMLAKEFHTWDFPLSKFKYANYVKKPYEHLEIAYEFIDRTGPRSYAVNVPIPKNNKEDIKKIISKFK